jgi:Protein of unknown function (DUF1360)
VTVPDWWAAVLLTLAAYRVFRLLALDTILDRPRAWVLRAGDWRPGDNALAPDGFRDELAKFVSCPWCAGFWIALGWWIAFQLDEHVALVVATPFAISAGLGLIVTRLDDT